MNILKERQQVADKKQEKEEKKNPNPVLNCTAPHMRWSQITLDGSLPTEEVEGHGGEECRDALLVMQMKCHHLS